MRSFLRLSLPLRWTILSAAAVLLVAGLWALRATAAGLTTGPDVTVIYLGSTSNYGVVSGVRGYSVGTTSCNVGSTPVRWCNSNLSWCTDEEHPVIAQNLYRLKDGRFQQLGLSWLKHGFVSTNSFDGACGSCVGPPHGGDELGVGCTDTYGSGLNGSRPLGMRSEVNATSGVFPYPYTNVGTSNVIEQRIEVAETELDPTLNPGARYWVEGQYVTADDAAAGNGLNNASYREVTVSAGTYNLNLAGNTIREVPAITVWPTLDAAVELVNVDVNTPPVERFHAARKVTDLGGGVFHYEYSIHNLNSDRSGRALTITFPGGTTISNAGFYGVKHHSGEPYATDDWTIDTATPGMVRWFTDDFATNASANALRWGTMFNFWFDADHGPSGMTHDLELFKPGSPTDVTFFFSAALFADGFETGDTSAWTATVP